jgi:hypothetical protein
MVIEIPYLVSRLLRVIYFLIGRSVFLACIRIVDDGLFCEQ